MGKTAKEMDQMKFVQTIVFFFLHQICKFVAFSFSSSVSSSFSLFKMSPTTVLLGTIVTWTIHPDELNSIYICLCKYALRVGFTSCCGGARARGGNFKQIQHLFPLRKVICNITVMDVRALSIPSLYNL